MTNALTVSGLTKTYPDFVLDQVSFSVPSGSIVGLIGENGAGKSTTINAALGLIQKEAGQVSVLGKDGLDGETRSAVLAAADVLNSRGAEIAPLPFPALKYAVPAYYIIAAAEASSNLSRYDGVKYGWRAGEYEGLAELYRKTRTQGFGAEVKRRILLGTFALSSGYFDAYYKKALQVKAVIKDAFDEAFQRCDLLLTPVAPAAAPRLGESLSDPLSMYLSDIYTVPANLAGLPALSMPCGFDGRGLPIGAQLVGSCFGEGTLLNAAHAFQQETDYHKRAPKGGVPA